jgi:hypothetical protein
MPGAGEEEGSHNAIRQGLAKNKKEVTSAGGELGYTRWRKVLARPYLCIAGLTFSLCLLGCGAAKVDFSTGDQIKTTTKSGRGKGEPTRATNQSFVEVEKADQASEKPYPSSSRRRRRLAHELSTPSIASYATSQASTEGAVTYAGRQGLCSPLRKKLVPNGYLLVVENPSAAFSCSYYSDQVNTIAMNPHFWDITS